MSLTSSGRTALARSVATAAGTAAARPVKSSQPVAPSAIPASMGTLTTSRSLLSVPAAAWCRSSSCWAAARRAASRSVPRNGPATMRPRAPLRLITSSASWPVNRVLTGTSVAPA